MNTGATRHRGQLFRKYFLLILALVCGAIVISGGVGLYFAYQENKQALMDLQREKAAGAAARIEQFVGQIEQQLAFAALPVLGPEGLEQRRIEFLRLLQVAPAVTDVAQLDGKGREQLTVSRLKMNTTGSNEDRSQEPGFKNARPGQIWFGPVYFRQETEPYMTMAVRSGNERGPVTVAEVNLKFIWDVVSRIRIGEKGKAYVIDATGYLIADPDIGLVLRKTRLSDLEQVKAAFAPGADESFAMLAKDAAGKEVLTAYAPIEPAREQAGRTRKASPLGWKVFVEQPASEVYAALDATILRTVALIVGGLLFSALAALYLARSMVRPIGVLQEGAQRIGAGDLDQKIEVRTGDELEALAGQFNRMTEQLRDSYAGLERKVAERTAELQQTLEQQTATSEILKVISNSTTDVQPVFEAIVRSGLRLFPDATVAVTLPEGDQVKLAAVAHRDEKFNEAWWKRFPFPLTREYMHGIALLERRMVDVADAQTNRDPSLATGMSNFLASGNRAITVMPMMRGDVAIGTVTVARESPGALSEKQIALLRTFADQAVIAIENVRLFNETKESLEQQTATSEILKVISSSTSDIQPVLEAIVRSAARLFPECNAHIFMRDGDAVQLRAIEGATVDPAMREEIKRIYPVPFDPAVSTSARAMAERRINTCSDTEAADVPQHIRRAGQAGRFRSNTVVPLVRDDEGIGTIVLTHPEPGHSLTEKEIALLRTFADQAVIAIENVRLFNETKEGLEQQTAIAEVLRVISNSPGDVRPVLQAVAERSARICDAKFADIIVVQGGGLGVAAATGDLGRPQSGETVPLTRTTAMGRSILERKVVHVPDIDAAGDEFPLGRELALRFGHRTTLAVPLVREDRALGTILLRRTEVRPFEDKHIALLRTFADQAAIAIENVRLFNETKESLEHQTAISEVLRVISASPTDVQPVLDIVAERAAVLCDAPRAHVLLVDGDMLRNRANFSRGGGDDVPMGHSIPLKKTMINGRAALEGRTIHVDDIVPLLDSEYPDARANQKTFGFRASLAVPLMREGRAIGTLYLWRREPGYFSPEQVKLLETFAAQAVIAIENVRLFNETKEALEQQTATAEVLNVISGSITDARPVFDAISRSVLRLYGARSVSLVVRMGERIDRVAYALADKSADDGSQALYPIPLDEHSLSGRAILRDELVHIRDLDTEAGLAEHSRAITRRQGVRSVLIAPMHSLGATTGALAVGRRAPGGFSEREVELIRTFADQAVIAMENVRLFREIEEKSAQLEVANKHKSEFLANMSHELRTPLNAIIGFSEVLSERMFGEINEKQADYLKDIHESGKHLLSLINDILDLSKIEAGRMDLELSRFHLPSALSNAVTLVRERAQRHGIQLSVEVDDRLGAFQADERKFKQIMLNLLSNAVKFTPDGGRIAVLAKKDTTCVEIAVRDTGIGIAPEDHAAVFEEFKQVGRDYTKKAEGTGLGLALTKRFVELHGGSIRLESAPGKGSTFTVSLPIRQ